MDNETNETKETLETCENCGQNTLKHYDGWLGYESMICQNTDCKAVYDHSGKWLNDQLVEF